jgi:hypothetical protein
MAEKFDPYYTWLGIPPEDQPPDHYALLGVRQFESNPDVISNLTDQRMAHVKTFQAGPHGADSQKLLNEIAAARVCLLNPTKRKAYDAELRTRIALKTAPEALPIAAVPEITPPPPVAPSPIAPPPIAQPPSPSQSDSVSEAFAFIAATARPGVAKADFAVTKAVQSRAKRRARARWLFLAAPVLGIIAVVVAIMIRNSQDADESDANPKSTFASTASDHDRPTPSPTPAPPPTPAPNPKPRGVDDRTKPNVPPAVVKTDPPPAFDPSGGKTANTDSSGDASDAAATNMTTWNRWDFSGDPTHASGYFERKLDKWLEFQNGTLLGTFDQFRPTAQSIDLYSPSQKIYMRLTATEALLSRDRSEWHTLGRGHFVATASAGTSEGQFPFGQSVDVLRLVDTNSAMVVAGKWSRDGREISVEPGLASAVYIPVQIKGSYDFEVEFTRASGDDSVNVILSVGSHPCEINLSGWGGRASGLDEVNGHAAIDTENPVAVRPGNIENGHRYRLLVNVRIDSDDHASIGVLLDGKLYLPRWSGNPATLTLGQHPRSLPYTSELGLGAWQSPFTFHSARLKIISGSALVDSTLISANRPPATASASPTENFASNSGAGGADPSSAGVARQGQPNGGFDLRAMRAAGPFSSRQGINRDALTEHFGGSKETELAVAAALYWLAHHQMRDGSWSLKSFSQMCKDRTCTGAGSVESLSAATAMGLLPFLAAGQSHTSAGAYKKQIAAGVAWLVSHQQANGDLSAGAPSQMYSHALAAIALCEDFGMTHDLKVRRAAQGAVNFIEAAQNRNTGGWRYHPGEEGDTSVLGWQMSALESAKTAGLSVRPAAFAGVKKWLSSVNNGSGRFSYQPDGGPTPPMSAVGVLCSQYLNVDSKDPVILGGVQVLMASQPSVSNRNVYYWYYATQAMHNMADEDWDTWNLAMRKALLETQEHQGCAAGSWDPASPTKDAWGPYGGRIMMTSLSCLTLEIYYRYLPTYVGTHGEAP